ncbi:MAG: serine/threonine protein kinase, partial [Clostridia bacterium]|nr:serine/threonine protein kinase [Clostridia bacterium]
RKAYLELSDIYKDSRHSIEGSLQQQISILEQAVRDLKDEDDIIIAEMLAEAYFTAQRYEDSIEKFSKLLDIGYARPYIYANIAIIYQQIGDYYSAEETLKEMLAKYPDDYRCYLRFAFLYLDMEGEKPESQRDYKKVVDNYDLAVRFSQQGANNPDLVPLRNKIAELKDKGWI